MCYFRELGQITNMNEVQMMITRTISRQKEMFNYEQIAQIIKQELLVLGVADTDVNSFKVHNMILDTLDYMVAVGDMYCFNNEYVPIKKEFVLLEILKKRHS